MVVPHVQLRARAVKLLHRYLGLLAALFWLIQAASGVAIAFRWEIDDALLAGPQAPIDASALGLRIEAIARAHGGVSSVWASGAVADRFDINYTGVSGVERVMRVNRANVPTLNAKAGNIRCRSRPIPLIGSHLS